MLICITASLRGGPFRRRLYKWQRVLASQKEDALKPHPLFAKPKLAAGLQRDHPHTATMRCQENLSTPRGSKDL